MVDLYDARQIEPLKKKVLFWRAFLIAFLCLALAGAAALFLSIEYRNHSYMVPLSVIYVALVSVLTAFFLCFFLLPYQAEISRIESFQNAYKHVYQGTYRSISPLETLRRGVKGQKATFLCKGKDVTLFLEENDLGFSFEAGKVYRLQTSDNFIVTVEEAGDD